MFKKNYLRVGLDWVYKLFFGVQTVCIYASLLTIVATVLGARDIYIQHCLGL